MYLKQLELSGFKSFAKKTTLSFGSSITAIVGPNGSGKSNVAESFRFVLGEQSMKSMRSKRGEDLIFNGTNDAPRANKASVKLVFDNTSKFLDVDFDEVSIERTVHRDGANEYSINGSSVRLKDVQELLAGAHVGASGHHIISQGEADRILNSNTKDRKAMIEDALGLRVFQYKKAESERKLEKTEQNVKEVESLRRENAPHLKFLKKQVEKVEKTRQMREEIKGLYKEYFKRELEYLNFTKEDLARKIKEPKERLHDLESQMKKAQAVLEQSEKRDATSDELIALEKSLQEIRREKDELVRELGRLDGELSSQNRAIEREEQQAASDENRTVLVRDLKPVLEEIEQAERGEDIFSIRDMLSRIRERLRQFLQSDVSGHVQEKIAEMRRELGSIQEKHVAVQKKVESVALREQDEEEKYIRLKNTIEEEKDSERDAEKAVLVIRAEENQVRGEIAHLEDLQARLRLEDEEFKRDLAEAGALVGAGALEYKNHDLLPDEILKEEREEQRKRKKEIEKMKIRIEDAGGGSGEEIVREYEQVLERDQFLESELADLEKSSTSLKELIQELTGEIDKQFKEGIEKINTEFNNFFELMFGGGSASLKVVKQEKRKRNDFDMDGEIPEEDEEIEEGIEIAVSLPRKKIRGLEMLSGGERALTSIALLFAMSQVNPPPFIILDETDAALDESNSRKYGDMVESLAKHSQLILITHNRETMSRAGVLYGVTMGNGGISKLLSIAFDEAVAVAK